MGSSKIIHNESLFRYEVCLRRKPCDLMPDVTHSVVVVGHRVTFVCGLRKMSISISICESVCGSFVYVFFVCVCVCLEPSHGSTQADFIHLAIVRHARSMNLLLADCFFYGELKIRCHDHC